MRDWQRREPELCAVESYSKQDVEDSSEAVQEFHDSGGDTRPLEYLKSKALTNEESESIEGEITLTELNHVLINKMKRSNAPKINKLKANLMRVIDEGGSSEEILDIESQIRELVYEDVMSALNNRKNYSILEDERPSKVTFDFW